MSQELKTRTGTKLKEPKIWYPLGFILHMKDTVSPIVIRRIQILNAMIILLFITAAGYLAWYSFLKPPTGEVLVAEWVEAAGGLNMWNNITRGRYNRTHRLFSETGKLLTQRVETVYFEKINGHVKLMADVETPNGEGLRIGKDKIGYWAVQNNQMVDPVLKSKELGMSCESHFCSPDCSMNMAFYRFSMPFKLTDAGVIAENGGMKLLDGKKAQVLNISYKPGVGRDSWVFYAHPEDNLIRKMEYHQYTDKGEVIPVEFMWSEYANEGGLQISHRWTRYWGTGKVLEEYIYSDFDFESALPEQFYNRPKMVASVNF